MRFPHRLGRRTRKPASQDARGELHVALRPHTGLRPRSVGQCYGGDPHNETNTTARTTATERRSVKRRRREQRGWMDGGSSARRADRPARRPHAKLTKGGRGVRPDATRGRGGGWCRRPLPSRYARKLARVPDDAGCPRANWRGGRMDGGRDSANPSPPLREGSPGKCGASCADEVRCLHTHPVIFRRYPSREGIHFATGRMCWCWGTGRSVLVQLTTLPPHLGGPYKATRTSE